MTGASPDDPAGHFDDGSGARSSPGLRVDNVRQEMETCAWALAVLPIGTLIGVFVWAAMGFDIRVPSVATPFIALALIVADKRRLDRNGRLSRDRAPSNWWFLFPPGYLFRRAARLGLPRVQAWVALACVALTFALRVALEISVAGEPDPLPDCADQASMRGVLDTFDHLPIVEDARIRGIVVTRQAETGQGPGKTPSTRSCVAVIKASDDADYNVAYVFERIGEGVVVHLVVR